jgi:hypothetical protein
MSSLATSSPHPPSDIDAVAGVLIDLVEADLVGLGRGWIERCGTRHERKAAKTFPIRARGHGREYSGYAIDGGYGFKTIMYAWFRRAARPNSIKA